MTERNTYNFRSSVKPLEKEPGIKDHSEIKILSAAGEPMEISKEFRTVSQEATASTLEDTKNKVDDKIQANGLQKDLLGEEMTVKQPIDMGDTEKGDSVAAEELMLETPTQTGGEALHAGRDVNVQDKFSSPEYARTRVREQVDTLHASRDFNTDGAVLHTGRDFNVDRASVHASRDFNTDGAVLHAGRDFTEDGAVHAGRSSNVYASSGVTVDRGALEAGRDFNVEPPSLGREYVWLKEQLLALQAKVGVGNRETPDQQSGSGDRLGTRPIPALSSDSQQSQPVVRHRRWQVEPETILAGGMEYGSHVSEPRVRLPTFDGKNDWQPFWVQFQFLTSNYGWDDSKKLGHLISCLQGAAMGYVAQLPVSIRSNLHSLTDSLARRFCDHVLPETYRANLQSMKRQPREDLYEYADRVKTLMTKAYPGLENTQLYVEMTIEYLVNGLADKNLIYDVLTKKPQTIEEALEMITWHECCKGSEKRTMVRQVMSKAIKCGDNLDQKGFVTEARLEQFGKELQEQCANAVTKAIRESNASHAGRGYDFKPRRQTFHNVECFECKEVGHFARNCPQRRPNQPVSQRNDFLGQRRNQNSNDLN